MSKPKSCKTCKHSRWWLTPSGRISRNSAGKCVVPLLVTPLLPTCVTKHYSYPREPFPRSGIVPDDGADCPLWEENTGKPISETTP